MKYSLFLLGLLVISAMAQDTTTNSTDDLTCDPNVEDGCSGKWGLDYCCARDEDSDGNVEYYC